MSRCKAVDIFEINTGKIISFESMRECSRYLGVKVGSVHWRLIKKSYTSIGGYVIKYKDDTTPWPILVNNIRFSYKTKEFKITLTDYKTGKVEIYDTVTEAGKFLGCQSASINYHFLRHPNVPYKGFLIEKIKINKEKNYD